MKASPEELPSISRRKVIGLGIATGVVLAAVPTTSAMAKAPWDREFWEADLSPEFKAAFDFAIKNNWKSGPGFWAVAYSDDNFTGDPFLVGTPMLLPKPQTGSMPRGWGSKTGSIVVAPGAVLRIIHKINGEDTHITLLPYESMAQVSAIGIADGQSTWKLYPAGNLRPPY